MIIKWALTDDCNLKCKHCYNMEFRGINYVDYDKAKDIIQNAKKNHITNIQFLGGEPLLHPNIIGIVEACTEAGITSWINTNGTLIDACMAKKLVDAGLDTIIISIDGPSSLIHDSVRGTGNFIKAVQGVQHFVNHKTSGLNININSVLNFQAVKNMNQYVEFISQVEGINSISFSLADIVGNASKQDNKFWSSYDTYFDVLKEFIPIMKDLELCDFDIGVPPLALWYFNKKYGTDFYVGSEDYCMGGSSVLYIEADGNVYPCNLPVGIKYFKNSVDDISSMNIYKNELKNIYNGKEMLSFFQNSRKRNLNMQKTYSDKLCGICPMAKKKICAIACPAEKKRYPASRMCELALLEYGLILLDEINDEMISEAIL